MATKPIYGLPLQVGGTVASKAAHDAEINRALGAVWDRGEAIDVAIRSDLASTSDALNVRIDGLSSGQTFKGPWDASSGAFPAGAARGDMWRVSVAGTVDGETFAVGDRLTALVDDASTTAFAGQWDRAVANAELAHVERNTRITRDQFVDLADLTYAEVSAGDRVQVTGLGWSEVLPPGATGWTVQTMGGVYLRSLRNRGVWDVQAAGLVGGGPAVDDSLAMRRLLELVEPGDTIVFPATELGYYLGGNGDEMYVPVGVNVIGSGVRRLYNPYDLAAAQDHGAMVIWNPDYEHGLNLLGSQSVQDIILYGHPAGAEKDNAYGIHGLSQKTSLGGVSMVNVQAFNFAHAFGCNGYVTGSKIHRCRAAQNLVGLRNWVDGAVVDFGTNANVLGMQQMTGANDTAFIRPRIEWNEETGAEFYQSVNCSIASPIVDRNGHQGISASLGTVLDISGGMFRRNGAQVLGQSNCAHITAEGANTSLTITGIKTRVGENDANNPGADITPDYAISLNGGQVGQLEITGCDLTGANVRAMNAFSTPVGAHYRNNAGLDDLVNQGFPKVAGGESFYSRGNTANLNAGGSEAVTLGAPALGDYSRRTVALCVQARRTATGLGYSGRMLFNVRREASAATITYVQTIGDPAGHIGVGPETVSVAATVSADGSIMTFTTTNNGADQIRVFLTLKEQ